MKKFLIQTAERAVSTYVEALLALIVVAGPLNLDKFEVAAVSALPAAFAVIKAALASRFGAKDSPALLPESYS